MKASTSESQPIPPGATWEGDGWNFALYSRHATGVTLLLYDGKNFVKPLAALTLDPLQKKLGFEPDQVEAVAKELLRRK